MNEQEKLENAITLMRRGFTDLQLGMEILKELGIDVNECTRSGWDRPHTGYNEVLLTSGMPALASTVGRDPELIYDGDYGLLDIGGVAFLQKVSARYE